MDSGPHQPVRSVPTAISGCSGRHHGPLNIGTTPCDLQSATAAASPALTRVHAGTPGMALSPLTIEQILSGSRKVPWYIPGLSETETMKVYRSSDGRAYPCLARVTKGAGDPVARPLLPFSFVWSEVRGEEARREVGGTRFLLRSARLASRSGPCAFCFAVAV